jgi:hypothetical protein
MFNSVLLTGLFVLLSQPAVRGLDFAAHLLAIQRFGRIGALT